jgi:predicted nucleotidyltransferase
MRRCPIRSRSVPRPTRTTNWKIDAGSGAIANGRHLCYYTRKLWRKYPMPPAVTVDPILRRFRAALDEIYGERIERVVLFGSRARGDAHEDSDYDVAVFLNDISDRLAEAMRLADLGTDILHETGELVNAMPYRAGAYDDERMPLMYEIRAEGIDL